MRIGQIFRFPIKGLPGEALDVAAVQTGNGIEGDRCIAFGNGTVAHADGQWASCLSFTILKNDKSLQKWAVESQPPQIAVRAPEADRLVFNATTQDGRDAARTYLSKHLATQGPKPRKVVSAPQGMFDSKLSGLSIVNPNTVRELSRASGIELDPRRFRGNLLVEGLPAFAEFDLIGKILRVGQARIAITKSIARCSATSVNPETKEVDTNGPRLLATHFGHIHCGIYGTVLESGSLETGAEIVVEAGTEASATMVPIEASPRYMEVESVQDLGGSVTELRLVDPFGWMNAQDEPGAHLRVHFADPLWRNYTITGIDQQSVIIAVRAHGVVSQRLARLQSGERVLASGPYGALTAAHVLATRTALVTAGIGITPALGLLRDPKAAGAVEELNVVHVERGSESALYSRLCMAVEQLEAEATMKRFDTAEGRPSALQIAAQLRGCDSVIICGPPEFTAVAFEACQLAGISSTQIHCETFASPNADLEELIANFADARISCTASGVDFTWQSRDGLLLEALEDRGIQADYSCRAGSCGQCAVKLVDGHISYPLEPSARTAEDQILACSAVPAGDITLEI